MLLDERGRVLARFNAIDAYLAAVTIVAGVAGFTAYAAVIPRTPVVTSVEPTTVSAGPKPRVLIHGHDLRPFLHALVLPSGTAPDADPQQGTPIGIGDTTVGELRLPPLPPGEYDLRIYDQGREVAALPSAFKVTR